MVEVQYKNSQIIMGGLFKLPLTLSVIDNLYSQNLLVTWTDITDRDELKS